MQLIKLKEPEPIKKEKQGQSKITAWKEVGFRAGIQLACRLSLGSNRKLEDYPFWYADLNCGSGRNERVDCDGSPLEFFKVMMDMRRYYHAYFCDTDVSAINALKMRIQLLGQFDGNIFYGNKNQNRTFTYNSSNATLLNQYVLPAIKEHETNWRCAVGAILSDPNGPSAKSFPLSEIQKFAKEIPKIDIIMNVEALALKRCRGVLLSGNSHGKPRMEKWVKSVEDWPARTLNEMTIGMNRNHWVIREPMIAEGHIYIMLIGRQREDATEERSLGFYTLKSKRGQEIINEFDSDKKR